MQKLQAYKHATKDLSNPDHCGWVYKQSTWLKQWRRRYCLLKGNLLYVLVDETNPPHTEIDLSKAVTVMSADEKARRENAFEVRMHDISYLFAADTDQERSDWISALGRAIVKSGAMYQDEEPGYDGEKQ